MVGSRPRGPRLEIPKSRVKLTVELLPAVVFFPILWLCVLNMDAGWQQVLAAGFLLFLTLSAADLARAMWRRPVLILTPTGFRVSPRDKTEVLWGAVAGFSLGRRHFGNLQWFRPVLFDHRPDRIPEPSGWFEVAMSKAFGSPTTGWVLGHGWDRAPEDVVETLESWRKRYG